MVCRTKKSRDYCVYRYTLESGEVIYIGKTDALLKQRIDAHQKEDKFAPYLGRWNIDYIELSNRVETDVVEKYLINLLKPVLNEKDHTQGLTMAVSMSLPEWIPYSKYEEKNRDGNAAAYSIAVNTARKNQRLFEDAYDAVLQKRTDFSSPFVHATGILPLPSGPARITKLDVRYVGCSYIQTINIAVTEELLSSPNQVQCGIWMPVATLFDFSSEQQERFEMLSSLLDFADLLYAFKEDGFYMEEDSERNMLRIKTNEHILSYFAPLICDSSVYGDAMYLEIDEFAYDSIPQILERICSEFLVLFKGSGVIPYCEE